MFLAGLHNGISRLYETFGNGGADTVKRILDPEEYSRTWYRQNPPLPIVTWSQRDNNNYEQSALLTTLSYFSHNTHHFLENYYLKSKRSILKPGVEGPAAWILPANDAELNRQLELLRVLKLQHVEISRLTEAAQTTLLPAKRGEKPVDQSIPAGSFVIRMDQPYSRAADALLDRQYWAPDDAQKHPYDDTGWSFSQLFNVKTIRATDPAILGKHMEPVKDLDALSGKVTGTGSLFAIDNSGQSSLLGLVMALKSAKIEVAEKPFESGGKHFAAGSLLISGVPDATLNPAIQQASLDATRLAAAPSVPTHAVAVPRIAFMHSWQGTQTEGWWRSAFDHEHIPYDYISLQSIAHIEDLRAKYDVILFAPIGRSSTEEILHGLPKYGNALPWEKTELTPNLGTPDSTPDMRVGLGEDGFVKLRGFVETGGLLITCEDTAQFAIEMGLAPGVSVVPHGETRVTGTVLNSIFVAPDHPVAYGYEKTVPVMSMDGMAFNVSNTVGRSGGRVLMDPYAARPTGRGSVDDGDSPQGRKPETAEPLVKQQPWEPKPINEDQARNNALLIPEKDRPEVILRFSETKTLLLSGLLDKAGTIAEHAIVIDAHLGKGNVLLFANRPIYRGETIGTYPLVFNAILNYNHLERRPATSAK